MKKTLIILVTVVMAIVAVLALRSFRGAPEKKSTTQSPEDVWVEQNREIPDVMPVHEPRSIDLRNEGEILHELTGGGMGPDFPLHFRYCYYASYGSFGHLVFPDGQTDELAEKHYEWMMNNLPHPEDFIPNGTAQEMPLVTMIKHYKIPKHVLVAEVERNREAWLSMDSIDLSEERYELPNADIIYTFDNEIINEFYRRK